MYVEGKYRTDQPVAERPMAKLSTQPLSTGGGQYQKFYGAALLGRMRPQDFGPSGGILGVPPRPGLCSNDDFAPYYDTAEKLYWVHGRRGLIPLILPGGANFRFPPLPHEPMIHSVKDPTVAAGVAALFSLPMGINRWSDQPIKKYAAFAAIPAMGSPAW